VPPAARPVPFGTPLHPDAIFQRIINITINKISLIKLEFWERQNIQENIFHEKTWCIITINTTVNKYNTK
jgi:hypothetical protein